ncbi:hypothetical protein SUGI_0711940 [Cryptomeria japonica]|nr:hypothetical protein SUGI_0711940 [Cryptomeria japonica]
MAVDETELVLDGSVNLKGKPVVRGKTGGWRACSLIIGYEFIERLAFAGIWVNLVVYLTTKLHEGTVSSARNASNCSDTLWITPLFGAYIADTYLGRFWTFIVFSSVYILGMGIMTLAVTLKSLRPPECEPNEVCQKASSLQIGFLLCFKGSYFTKGRYPIGHTNLMSSTKYLWFKSLHCDRCGGDKARDKNPSNLADAHFPEYFVKSIWITFHKAGHDSE